MSYDVIVADPPWKFSDKLGTRGAEHCYPCMSIEQIKTFLVDTGVEPAKASLLFLWRVSSMQEEALEVCRAWGFAPKSEIVWEKTAKNDLLAFGMGRYVRMSHENCLIAVRGKGLALVKDHAVRSVIRAQRGRHSEKPDLFYETVERMCPTASKIELFARTRRAGWAQHGNQLPELGAA